MPTKLFLRNTENHGLTPSGDATWYDMVTTAGAAADTAVVDTTASGTEIQFTKTAGGATIAWISGAAPAGGFTLTTTDVDMWLQESNMNANIGGRYRVFKRAANGTITELGGGPFNDGVEFGTSAASMTWIGNVTDTAFAEDDRILIRVYITNVGTMGAGHTGTLTFNAADGTTGDSFFNIAETVTFKGPAQSVGPGTIASGHQLFAPTVVPGDVAVTTGTITAATQLFAPTVVPGDVAVTGETIAATQLFAPTVAQPSADPVLINAQFVVGGTRPDVFTSVPFVAGRTYFLAMMIDKAGGQTDWSVELVQFLHGATDRTSSWIYRTHTHVSTTRSLGIFQYDCATTETVNFSYQGDTNGNVRFGALIECPGTATIVQSAVIGPVAAALNSGSCTLGSAITGSNISLAFVGTRNANADQSVIPRTGWTELSDTPTGEGSAGSSGTLQTQFDSPGEQSASASAAAGPRTWGVIHIEISIAGAGAQAVTGGTISSGNQLFAPTLAYVVAVGTVAATTLYAPTLAYAITTAFQASAAQLFAPTIANTQLVTNGTIASGHQLFAPTLAQAVVTGSIGPTVVVSAPTLSYVVQLPAISGTTLSPPTLAYAVTAGFRASAATLFAPTVTPAQAVTAGTVASGLTLYAPTVTVGPVSITTGTIAATALYAPTVAAGPVAVTGGTIAATALHAPTVATLTFVTAGFRASALTLFAPALSYAVTTGTRASALQLFAPTVAYAVTTAFRASELQLFAPTITAAGAISGGHVASTTTLYAPTLTTLTLVTTGTIASGLTLYAPSLTYVITTATVAATVLYAPTLVQTTFVTAGTIAATLVFAPTLTAVTPVSLPSIPSTVALYAPTLGYALTGGFISGTQVFGPTVLIGQAIEGGFINSTVIYAPVVRDFELPEVDAGATLVLDDGIVDLALDVSRIDIVLDSGIIDILLD